MAKKTNAIYAPGELDRVRGKLGVDDEEAKRMAQILGGEVGVERGQTPDGTKGRPKRSMEPVDRSRGGKRPARRHVELSGSDEENALAMREVFQPEKAADPLDDPSLLLKPSYFERVKMDRYAAQSEFDIKSSTQVLISILSFFSDPPDYVNPYFINKRIGEYYRKIEQLVTATRNLFPRNNLKRNERLKRASPFAYAVLDTIRYWNIERIITDMSKIQAHPRSARAQEFADILRAVYKPLFVMEKLNMENHIKGAFKLLYKILYLEHPMEAKDKFQELIRTALTSFAGVRREVHFSLYPLLMKMISDRWLPYELLFIQRRRRLMAFLNTTEQEQIKPVDMDFQQAEGDMDLLKEDLQKEQQEKEQDQKEAADETAKAGEETSEENASDPQAKERKAQEAAKEADRKAQERALATLEVLFPNAGWDELFDYPDLYPYFANVYSLRKGYELIAPTDPLQQIAVLMHIMEDLLIALRYVDFGTVTGSDGSPVGVAEHLGKIILNWRSYIDDAFVKEYLPRLMDYCRILENSAESRTSPYAKKIINELHWIKRLYFLPFYKFESFGPPPFQKQDITAIYGEVRTLRKYLTLVAAGIEQATRQNTGSAGTKVPCDGINNPWAPYNFEVPNPVSKRLDMLLSAGKRNNSSLIFFSLAVITVLDSLINNENSWVYGGRPGPLFRSVNGAGVVPMFGVDNKLDADLIFKNSLKKKEG